MAATVRPPIPDVPACYSWPLTGLPQLPGANMLRVWQNGRCAVCGGTTTALVEDHDHATGNVRGYLCDRCNLAEGRYSPRPAFLLYRERNPASIMGIAERYPYVANPSTAAGEQAWLDALVALDRLADDGGHAWREREFAELRRLGVQGDLGWLICIPERTPLMDAAERVGITLREWGATLQERRAISRAETVHLPDEVNPPRDACRPQWSWSRPRRPMGGRVAACEDCWLIDRERLAAMVAAFSPCEAELAFAREPANAGAGGVL